MKNKNTFEVGDIIKTETPKGPLLHQITKCINKQEKEYAGVCLYTKQKNPEPGLEKPGWLWTGVLGERDKKLNGLIKLLFKDN